MAVPPSSPLSSPLKGGASRSPLVLGLVFGGAVLALGLLAGISLGVGAVGWLGFGDRGIWLWREILGALDPSWGLRVGKGLGLGTSAGPMPATLAQFIVWDVRWPRTLGAIAVGGSLAVAGALMQGLTRNPLADPGLLGINGGAALAVVAAVFWGGDLSLSQYGAWALGGAAAAALTIYGLGSLNPGGLSPLNMTLAGAALTAVLSALTTGILILSQRTLDDIRFWLVGSVNDRTLPLVLQGLPAMGLGLAIALTLGRALTVLSLGDTMAQGLGQRPGRTKVWGLVSVVLLAGGAVSVAGPLGFVGLVVPHGVRWVVGQDYRWIVPGSAVAGAIVLLGADVALRWLLPAQALPVGLVLPLVGAPLFLYGVMRRL
ncbi:FecCD family ABC transporter permease [Prochlorothrix hollandica]|uniref:FecCD family ABC transporter permease n=1 Tax=Prochlorothrix hollandica TaxID=1223 RepID=UPI00034C3030|nr:iron ABC transporter permease [Prochlorothrix hollandica]